MSIDRSLPRRRLRKAFQRELDERIAKTLNSFEKYKPELEAELERSAFRMRAEWRAHRGIDENKGAGA